MQGTGRVHRQISCDNVLLYAFISLHNCYENARHLHSKLMIDALNELVVQFL